MNISKYQKRMQLRTRVRKLFVGCNLTRSPSQRIREGGTTDPNTSGPININPRITSRSIKPLCVALLNEDPIEDVIIITKLDDVPFCCHVNLLEMPRDQLVAAALSMNSKLPAAMQIDVRHHCSDMLIRQSIEFLVGLRHTIHRAPKAVKVQSELGTDSEVVGFDMTPPSSPLATRIRQVREPHITRGRAKLPRLDEENETEETVKSERPPKRRKLDSMRISDSPIRLHTTHPNRRHLSSGTFDVAGSAFKQSSLGTRAPNKRWDSLETIAMTPTLVANISV